MGIENKGFFASKVRKFAQMTVSGWDFADADLQKFYFIKSVSFHPPFLCG